MSSSDDQRDNSEENSTSIPKACFYNIDSAKKHIYRSAPGYSFGVQHQDYASYNHNRSPGPCYSLPSIDCYKRRAPRINLYSRSTAKFKSPLDEEYKQ